MLRSTSTVNILGYFTSLLPPQAIQLYVSIMSMALSPVSQRSGL